MLRTPITFRPIGGGNSVRYWIHWLKTDIIALKISDHIIGGMFGQPVSIAENSEIPPFINRQSIFLVNARSGIFLLTELLSPRKVWVPSYLCHTILEGVRKAGGCVEFYVVNYDLQIDSYDWIKKVGEGDLVVLIDYFGWTYQKECIDLIKEQGACVLEDASQAMFTEGISRFSDFTLLSPRKFLGVPDGGILTPNSERFELNDVVLSEPPEEWWLKAFTASALRREFDTYGGSNHWYELYQNMDSTHPIGRYAMSHLSRVLLYRCFDYSDIIRRRVNNYRTLASHLAEIAIFPEIPDGVVPLGFPVRIMNRDNVRQSLFKERIYPPVHWLIKGIVPDTFRDSHILSNKIMTLPCDQRYDVEDMERVARLIQKETSY